MPFDINSFLASKTVTIKYRYSTLRAYLCWRHSYCQWPIIELAKNVSPKNTQRAYLCWRHSYCQWPIIELTKNVSPKNKMAASHVVQIHTHARFPRSKKMVDLSCSCTNRKRSSFATKHFQRKSLKIFDLHPPLRRLVSFVARIIT